MASSQSPVKSDRARPKYTALVAARSRTWSRCASVDRTTPYSLSSCLPRRAVPQVPSSQRPGLAQDFNCSKSQMLPKGSPFSTRTNSGRGAIGQTTSPPQAHPSPLFVYFYTDTALSGFFRKSYVPMQHQPFHVEAREILSVPSPILARAVPPCACACVSARIALSNLCIPYVLYRPADDIVIMLFY